MPLKIEKPKGRKYWYITGTVAGQRIRESAKTASKRIAQQKCVRREAELEQRSIFGPEAVATFAEAVNAYLDAAGEDRYLSVLLERFGTTRLIDITQHDLDRSARDAFPDVKPSTLNRYFYTPFIAAYNAAANAEKCPHRRWKRPKGHNKRTRFRWLWPDEYEATWLAAPPHGRVVLDLLAGTGIREAEGVWLDWDEVNLALGQGWIWEAKNEQPRRIELPPRTVASLANLDHREGRILLNAAGDEYVLGVGGGGVLGKGLRLWASEAGVEPFGAHVLRHTFATWFYSVTLDRERLRALGGWKSDEVDRYCHLAPLGLKNELERFGWDFSGRTKQDSSVPVLRQL